MSDTVNHPQHYLSHPSKVECITITEQYNFNLGNAIKYIWRAGLKTDDPTEDLAKAQWYLNREIGRLRTADTPTPMNAAKIAELGLANGYLTELQADWIESLAEAGES